MKLFAFLLVLVLPFAGYAQNKVFNINAYGTRADGFTDNKAGIQKAIDDANTQGGGVVLIPAGEYLTGPLTLKSNVTLKLAANAVLKGTAKRIDYGSGYASPLIMARGQHNIGITGRGTIDGNAYELLKDVFKMLEAGQLKDALWKTENPWGQIQPEEPNRPRIIGFYDCNNIAIKGVSVKNGLVWVQEYKNCTDINVDSIKVESNTYWNNDGIDLVDCKNARVTNSFFNADDDGICLKSSDRKRRCENIFIANCTIRSSASAIKLGTASWGGFKKITIKDIKVYDNYRSAIALEAVDGGIMEDIDVSNVHAVNTGNAIFIRLGHRNKDSVYSIARRIRISNLTAEIPAGKPDKGYPYEGPLVKVAHNIFPSSIAGLPGHPVEDVVLENIKIVYKGVADKNKARVSIDSLAAIPENEGSYPEFSMFGELPAWGFYARHASGITFKNVTLSHLGSDFRSACVFDDVNVLNLHGLSIPQVKGLPVVVLRKVSKPTLGKFTIPGKAVGKIKTL